MTEGSSLHRRDELARMQADAVLAPEFFPAHIWSNAEGAGAPRLALLTGGCGFLGRHVARELLRDSELRLVCLVREKPTESAASRTARIFASIGICQAEFDVRVEVRVGNLTAPYFGLDADDYADLSRRVDTIYHCAASVDWVRGYGQLYPVNVGGALAIIQMACRGKAKRLVFVSSVAVCYAWGGPERVDEDTDMLPFVGGMPLGYARSKCVAEALLRQAATRGVPVTILRPALIAGDSTSGECNPSDLIAALVQGCVATSMAIDTDWLLDCVPVDFVARAITQVPQGKASFQVLNLVHEHPRYWSELILWMNLHGYHVDLVESGAWIRHLFADGHGRGTLLYSQRQFFLGRPNPQGGGRRARPFEAYLADGQRQLHASRTRALLNRLEIREAPLDADLLHAYFDYYRRAGLLPPRALDGEETLTLEGLLRSEWSLSGVDGTARRWPEAERTRITSDDGLLSEIAAARVSGSVGLWRLHFRDNAAGEGRGPNSAVLKAKASDRLIQDLTVQLAGVCRPELGKLFGRFRDALGLAGSHERELALYELDEPRLRKHMPARFGTLRDPVNGRWALLLEYLPEAATGAGLLQLGASDPGMKAVLNGLAQIHAVWFGREAELAAEPWLAATPDKDRMNEMRPLWRELADFAAPCFEAWCGSEVRKLQATFIGDLGSWWPRLRSLPATLIHNDFNPRNMVLRQADGLPQLCVYDWELATLGIPQHDLAELLCFTFRSDATKEDLQAVADAYREILSSVCGQEIYLPEWRAGFTLALRHLLIDRLAMYSLMHRFRRLEYLPRVMGNWMRIYGWAKDWVDF